MVDIVDLNELLMAEGCNDMDELDVAKNLDELDDLVVAKSLDELNELVKLDNQLEVGNTSNRRSESLSLNID
jgi:hypothetical protein